MLKKKNIIIFSLIIAVIVIADQASKYLVRKSLFPGQSVSVIGNFFHLTYVENTGIAFGMLKGLNLILIFVILAIMVFLFLFRKSLAQANNPLSEIAVIIVLGGALGNFIDRVHLGKITDFLDFGLGNYQFPTFNVADSCITIGGILLAFSLLQGKRGV